MPHGRDVIDELFAEVNAGLDSALVPPQPLGQMQPPEYSLLNWNVVTQGARQNEEDGIAKRRAIQASTERRMLRELRAKMEKERRKREKLKRMEIKEYQKARGKLVEKETTARMLRRPLNWEVRNAGDMQHRRHGLKKLLRGEFTSLKKPDSLNEVDTKIQLEPLLQHWMPQHTMAMPRTSEKHEVYQANLRRQENVKKAIQKQRWVKMMNSSTFSDDQMVNVAKIRKKANNKLGDLTALMQGQKFSTAPASASKVLLQNLGMKGKAKKKDVDYSLLASAKE